MSDSLLEPKLIGRMMGDYYFREELPIGHWAYAQLDPEFFDEGGFAELIEEMETMVKEKGWDYTFRDESRYDIDRNVTSRIVTWTQNKKENR